MEKTTTGDVPLAEVGLGPDEDLETRIRAVLGARFSVSTSPARDLSVDLRIFGPDEISRGRERLLRRHRLHQPGVPGLVIFPEEFGPEDARDCFREGAVDGLRQSEIETQLVPCLELALQRRNTGRSLEDNAQRMAAELGKRARELEQALSTIRESYDQTLAALVGTLDCRERETAYHSQRVALYAVMLGLELGLVDEELEDLYRGSLLHDLGKIGTPDAVLLKPDALSPSEWEIMREHANLGADLCRRVDFLRGAADVPLAHHEAFDGSGYPRGLAGHDIPLHARIFAIVDTYDAIRSLRPYKPPLDHAEAVRRLKSAAGGRLDPSLVEAFVAISESTWDELTARVSLETSFVAAQRICHEVGRA